MVGKLGKSLWSSCWEPPVSSPVAPVASLGGTPAGYWESLGGAVNDGPGVTAWGDGWWSESSSSDHHGIG